MTQLLDVMPSTSLIFFLCDPGACRREAVLHILVTGEMLQELTVRHLGLDGCYNLCHHSRHDAKPFASKMLDSCLRSMSLSCKRRIDWLLPDLVNLPRVLKPTLYSFQMLPCRLSSVQN